MPKEIPIIEAKLDESVKNGLIATVVLFVVFYVYDQFVLKMLPSSFKDTPTPTDQIGINIQDWTVTIIFFALAYFTKGRMRQIFFMAGVLNLIIQLGIHYAWGG